MENTGEREKRGELGKGLEVHQTAGHLIWSERRRKKWGGLGRSILVEGAA